MKDKITNIVVAGVGGQGVLLTSDIIAKTALKEGWDVKKSEVHGMAQRGGSVISEVRFGEKIYSPLIKKGKADYLLTLEKLEALRYIDYLKQDGILIVNDLEISPMGVSLGKEKYPENIYEVLQDKTSHLLRVKALDLAEKAGNVRTMNLVLLGMLSRFLSFKKVSWEKTIENEVPRGTFPVNMRAFQLGQEYTTLFDAGRKK